MLDALYRAFVQAQLSTCSAQTETHQGQAVAECGERLAENGILLPLELGEQCRDCLRVRLIDPAAGDQLIDQVLNVLPTECRKRPRRNIEQLEVVGYLQPHVAGEGIADSVNLDIEHYLGS